MILLSKDKNGSTVICWTLEEAIEQTNKLKESARARGYTLALYGSCLNGVGRDLDLLAVPWRLEGEREDLVKHWETYHHLMMCHKVENMSDSFSYIFKTKDGKLIDVSFKKVH